MNTAIFSITLPPGTYSLVVSKRSYTLALVTSDLVVYPKLILASIEAEARRRGYKLLVNVINALQNPPPAQDERVLNDLAAYQADGIIWAVEEALPTFELWVGKAAETPQHYLFCAMLDWRENRQPSTHIFNK